MATLMLEKDFWASLAPVNEAFTVTFKLCTRPIKTPSGDFFPLFITYFALQFGNGSLIRLKYTLDIAFACDLC